MILKLGDYVHIDAPTECPPVIAQIQDIKDDEIHILRCYHPDELDNSEWHMRIPLVYYGTREVIPVVNATLEACEIHLIIEKALVLSLDAYITYIKCGFKHFGETWDPASVWYYRQYIDGSTGELMPQLEETILRITPRYKLRGDTAKFLLVPENPEHRYYQCVTCFRRFEDTLDEEEGGAPRLKQYAGHPDTNITCSECAAGGPLTVALKSSERRKISIPPGMECLDSDDDVIGDADYGTTSSSIEVFVETSSSSQITLENEPTPSRTRSKSKQASPGKASPPIAVPRKASTPKTGTPRTSTPKVSTPTTSTAKASPTRVNIPKASPPKAVSTGSIRTATPKSTTSPVKAKGKQSSPVKARSKTSPKTKVKAKGSPVKATEASQLTRKRPSSAAIKTPGRLISSQSGFKMIHEQPSSSSTSRVIYDQPSSSPTSRVIHDQPSSSSTTRVIYDQPSSSSTSRVIHDQPSSSSTTRVIHDQPSSSSTTRVIHDQPSSSSTSRVIHDQPSSSSTSIQPSNQSIIGVQKSSPTKRIRATPGSTTQKSESARRRRIKPKVVGEIIDIDSDEAQPAKETSQATPPSRTPPSSEATPSIKSTPSTEFRPLVKGVTPRSPMATKGPGRSMAPAVPRTPGPTGAPRLSGPTAMPAPDSPVSPGSPPKDGATPKSIPSRAEGTPRSTSGTPGNSFGAASSSASPQAPQRDDDVLIVAHFPPTRESRPAAPRPVTPRYHPAISVPFRPPRTPRAYLQAEVAQSVRNRIEFGCEHILSDAYEHISRTPFTRFDQISTMFVEEFMERVNDERIGSINAQEELARKLFKELSRCEGLRYKILTGKLPIMDYIRKGAQTLAPDELERTSHIDGVDIFAFELNTPEMRLRKTHKGLEEVYIGGVAPGPVAKIKPRTPEGGIRQNMAPKLKSPPSKKDGPVPTQSLPHVLPELMVRYDDKPAVPALETIRKMAGQIDVCRKSVCQGVPGEAETAKMLENKYSGEVLKQVREYMTKRVDDE